MKLGPVTKLDKRKKTTSKKFDDGMTSFSFYGRIVCNTYIFINVIFYVRKTKNKTITSLTQLSHCCLE